MQKLTITFPNKLALPNAQPLSRWILCFAMISVAFSPLFIILEQIPVYGLFSAALFALIEYMRGQELSREAIRFVLQRIFLWTIWLVVLSIISLQLKFSAFYFWKILLFTQTPLSLYDAKCIKNGNLGPRFFSSIKMVMLNLYGRFKK